MKRLMLLLVGVVAGLGLVAGAAFVRGWLLNAAPPPQLHGVLIDSPSRTTDFSLPATDGQRVHLSDFRGRLVLLYFGYTFCPDVCPTTMSDLAKAVDALGPQADEVQVIMVSVDPERDTPDRMAIYAQAFCADFIGLSGTPDEITNAATPFGIYFQKAEGSAATGYLVTHTSTVTVIDRQGFVRLVWPFGVKGDDMASDLRYLLGQ